MDKLPTAEEIIGYQSTSATGVSRLRGLLYHSMADLTLERRAERLYGSKEQVWLARCQQESELAPKTHLQL